jgi:acyl-CoA synthetase (NDP forming)
LLARLFDPRSVAVVGASANPRKLGHALVQNLQRGGYRGRIYPVGRGGEEILGMPSFSSLRALPEVPDLVLVSVPAAATPEIAADAAAIDAGAMIVLACGFAEAGDEGRGLQRALLEQAGAVRVIGPTCMGVANLHASLNATYFRELPAEPGPVAVISQTAPSGALRSISCAATASACRALSRSAT